MERSIEGDFDDLLYDGPNCYLPNTQFSDSASNRIDRIGSPQLTSDPSYSITSSSMHVGRNKNAFTFILEKFQTKNSKPPKREYFNAFIIRAIKRAFRCIISSKIPKTTSIQVKITDQRQMQYWNELGNIYRGNISYITELAKTDTGPQTDGKKKGKASKEPKSDAKSFNNKFCQDFFSKKPAQQAFFCLIEIFYSTYDPNELSQRFKFSCCANKNNHRDDCMSKWAELKDYFNCKYFEELDVNIIRNIVEMEEIQAYGSMMEIEELQEYPD